MIPVKDKKTASFYALNPAPMGLFQLSTDNPEAAVAWGEITGKNEEQKKSATAETKFLPTEEWILYSLKSILPSSTANTNYDSVNSKPKQTLSRSSLSHRAATPTKISKNSKCFDDIKWGRMREKRGRKGEAKELDCLSHSSFGLLWLPPCRWNVKPAPE